MIPASAPPRAARRSRQTRRRWARAETPSSGAAARPTALPAAESSAKEAVLQPVWAPESPVAALPAAPLLAAAGPSLAAIEGWATPRADSGGSEVARTAVEIRRHDAVLQSRPAGILGVGSDACFGTGPRTRQTGSGREAGRHGGACGCGPGRVVELGGHKVFLDSPGCFFLFFSVQFTAQPALCETSKMQQMRNAVRHTRSLALLVAVLAQALALAAPAARGQAVSGDPAAAGGTSSVTGGSLNVSGGTALGIDGVAFGGASSDGSASPDVTPAAATVANWNVAGSGAGIRPAGPIGTAASRRPSRAIRPTSAPSSAALRRP